MNKKDFLHEIKELAAMKRRLKEIEEEIIKKEENIWRLAIMNYKNNEE